VCFHQLLIFNSYNDNTRENIIFKNNKLATLILFQPEFQYIYENSEITSGNLCAILDSPGCGAWDEMNNWFVDIPAGKPETQIPTLPKVLK